MQVKPAPMKLPEAVVQCLYATGDEAAAAMADDIAARLREAVAARGSASLMLSGGRSPIPFFEKLSQAELDWSRVTVSLVDDRWVDATDADSNELLLRQYLLKNAAATAKLIPLKNAAATPEQGLAEAERALAPIALPFDILVLGMGDDGHTASLFPGAAETPAALVSTRRLAAVNPTTAPHARITLTLPTLLNSRALYVAINGESKRGVIENAVVEKLPMGEVLLQSKAPTFVYWSP